MPKVTYTTAKGLYQESGSGLDLTDGALNHKAATKTTTSDTTLTASDSGSVVFLDGSTTHDVTLPSAKAGLCFTFFLTDATADVDVVQAGASEDFVGAIVDGAGTKDSGTASDTKIIFDQSGGATVGDWVYLISDGTNWYVQGLCDNAAGVVFG
tara:strand:- start:592 stop:1053 length:462 start_codon:yes stop_codon:yes gene_type:complete